MPIICIEVVWMQQSASSNTCHCCVQPVLLTITDKALIRNLKHKINRTFQTKSVILTFSFNTFYLLNKTCFEEASSFMTTLQKKIVQVKKLPNCSAFVTSTTVWHNTIQCNNKCLWSYSCEKQTETEQCQMFVFCPLCCSYDHTFKHRTDRCLMAIPFAGKLSKRMPALGLWRKCTNHQP